MGKNVVIFSDGTGKSSGVYLDENRSNIYKLYRATRSGPETDITASQQVAFYDPGVGTAPLKMGFGTRLYYRFMSVLGKATGLGITGNVVECYAALIRLWEPGDKIFLFGFSRGAYTVRLLGGVMAHCGIPYRTKDGKRVPRDRAGSMRLARHAVTKIYQHMESIDPKEASDKQRSYLDQRRLLGNQFRKEFGASNEDGTPNVAPYFIGVFDTVSSLFNKAFMVFVLFLSICALIGVPSLIEWLGGWPFQTGFLMIAGLASAAGAFFYLRSHLKMPGAIKKDGGGSYSAWETLRFSNWQMKFDDLDLSTRVDTARHALAIDERRKLFKRVPWTNDPDKDISGKPTDWFEQVWFAGVHSDIGGGYTDNEASLSDITLEWMIDAAEAKGLKIDRRWLSLSPCADGPQHDEARKWFFRLLENGYRPIEPQAVLHETVIERLKAEEIVDLDESKLYRPSNLKTHGKAKVFWEEE